MNIRPARLRPMGDARSLFAVAFGPSMVTLVVVAVVGTLVMVTQQSDLAAAFATVAELWLAVHQVPVTVSDITVSVLPLMPTVLLLAGVARVCRTATRPGRPLSELRTVLLCAIAGPVLFTAIALAVVNDATGTFTVGTPPPLAAFLYTVGVHLLGALIGLAPAYWREIGDLLRIPRWMDDVVVDTARALAAFAVAGAAIVVVRLAVQWHTVAALVETGNGGVGMFCLTVLSMLYLPNVMLGAAGITVGAGAQVGPVAASLFSAAPGQVPAVPILAVLPGGEAPHYLLVLLLVPAAVAVSVGRRCAAREYEVWPVLRALVLTALLTAAGLAAITWVAGGELGGIGHAGVDLPQLFGFTFAWIALVGALTALAVQQFGDTRAVRATRRSEEAVAGPAGYATYSDEAEPVDDEVPVGSVAHREGAPEETGVAGGGGELDGAAEPDDHAAEPESAREPAPESDADESDDDTGDFDAVSDEPTEDLRPTRVPVVVDPPRAERPERRPERGTRPALSAGRPAGRRASSAAGRSGRDQVVSDVEELDSYTFGE
ncbi:cell division protein PerM [Tsukamurella soli]|uniref:Integral membrane protein n=2 Tax=Tsukamurella soli TaxID=644556 RepID=A0ABP8JP05_9ACTN